MPDLSIPAAQLEELETIREELESAYVGEYGTVRIEDAVQYLLDTYTPPETADSERTPADLEGLTTIDGVGEATAESLAIAGFRSVEDVAAATPDALAEIGGIGDEQAIEIVAAAVDVEGESGSKSDSAAEMEDDEGTTADSESGGDRSENSPEDTLQQAMSLLDAHGDRWREADGDEPYEVDLPDGSTEAVRTKDDVRRLLFKHWR